MWRPFETFLNLLGDDWRGITLNLLKFLGVAVSGFAGIVATASEKPKRGERAPAKTKLGKAVRDVFSKRWALRWAVIGLAVALLSQFVETIKTAEETKRENIKEAEDKRSTDKLLSKLEEESSRSKESLEQIERLATPLDEVDMSVTLILEPDCLSWSNFLSEIGTEHPLLDIPSSAFTHEWTNDTSTRDPTVGTISRNNVGYVNWINKAGQPSTWILGQTNNEGEPPTNLPPNYSYLLTSGTMPTSLYGIIANQYAHLVIYAGAAGTGKPKLLVQDAPLVRPAQARFLPPCNYHGADAGKFTSFNATTNWAFSLDYTFACRITNSSLVGFPLSLPDLESKQAVLVLKKFYNIIFFSRVTWTNLVFTFGRSTVVFRGGLPESRQQDSPGSDFSLITNNFDESRTRTYGTSEDAAMLGFPMAFQFPDKATLFGRNHKN